MAAGSVDEIGLLTPSARSDSGYRLYSAADLQRLQRILFYRNLELGLDEIAQILADPEERWGDSDAWEESQRRSAAYTKDDWVAIKREADENIRAFADVINAGEPATSVRAMELAEAHRQHTSRWFYDCSHERHRALARLYVADARYMEPWDDIAPGFSRYVHDAIIANAERAGAAGAPSSSG